MRNQNQIVAVEGYPFIGIFAFVTLVFALLDWSFLTFLTLCLTLFTVYFFRNPERHVPQDEEAVVAPADGKVIFVGNVMEEQFFKEEVTKVSIFMSVFNVHVNRAPFPGKVLDMFYNKGEFFNASLDKASLQNEQAGILLETPGGKKLLFVQIAGLVARRIVTYPVIGTVLEKGMRYGLIRFGSRVDIYFPPGSEVTAIVGDNTVGGETIIGYIR
ncbi:phosphatidylserine decarboxylase family protein [Desulfuromonas sp. AOP6]|uniref:phosphatidylserine decarboxylase family protein n=1 Tax=Desulfuromonas sp. AOP6 TaxID=1566351 RepID=UPI0012770234|nr:phosphatidylserine decarboxylase family protein [Desulfuromonas sp. AOP6]BCA79845.1 phosphatidylserine decarboxylase proenzyme [Desulfuromonas sp. AOP6]